MKSRKLITLFDVSVCSANLGDQIITERVKEELEEAFPEYQVVNVASHDFLGLHSYKQIFRSQYVFVGGSNLLSSNMPFYRQWKLRLIDVLFLRDIVLLGVGWWQYQKKPNLFTRFLLRRVLSSSMLHSVRDEYTKNMLESIGIKNVVNTGCPTMWRLGAIPSLGKRKKVVTTITDYNFSSKDDVPLIELLLENYEQTFVWLQGDLDREKLSSVGLLEKLTIINPSLRAFKQVLQSEDVDYVGTRLHAGVCALQYGRRALIVEIDNRAAEIAKSTKLQTMRRGGLEEARNWIEEAPSVEVDVKREDVGRFLRQFEVGSQ